MVHAIDPQASTVDGRVQAIEPVHALHPLDLETPNNLPTPLTRFVGRRQELAAIERLLASSRLLTLTGPGGIGKSRLALEVAQLSLGRFPGGAWHVTLADVRPADPVERTVVASVGMLARPDLEATEAIAQAFGDRHVLLVLDECEWIVASLAVLVPTLLRACPNLRVLATSRQPLRIGGETLFPVPGLAISRQSTGLHDLVTQDAIALFIDRVRAQRPDLHVTERTATLVQELCQKLDGCPLAIELAAARARHFELDDLVARLDDQTSLLRAGPLDAPPRQRSLEATVDWSLGLLSTDARSVLPDLAVFRGGFDLDAAEAVVKGTDGMPAADVLSELVDHSLLIAEGVHGRTRYRMLEPIRQRAIGLLEATGGRESAVGRHAAYFATLARGSVAASRTADEGVWLNRLEADHDNLRWALEWALENVPDDGLALAADLAPFQCQRGHIAEGREWLESALSRTQTHAQRGPALIGLGWLSWMLHDPVRALECAEGALALSSERNDPALEARAWMLLGQLALLEPDRARGAYEAATRAAIEAADETLLVEILGDIADAEWFIGDRTVAVEHARRAAEAARRIGSPTLILVSTMVLARDATFAERPEAESLWLECLRASRDLGDPSHVQYCQQFLALVASGQRDFLVAAERLEEVADILRRDQCFLLKMQFVELVGFVSCRAGRPLEGLRLIACKESAESPDWIQSRPWRDLLRSEVEAAIAALGPRAAEARSAGAGWSLDRGVAEAEREVGRLRTMAAKARPTAPAALSHREVEIVRLASYGLTNREIGRRLLISDRTAEAHIQHILNKLGFANRAQIAAWAVSQGLALDEAT